jgi:hypothetical protein
MPCQRDGKHRTVCALSMSVALHTVTGTTGNIGCADTILLLKRGRSESGGVLYVTGRDVVEGVFKAEFHNGVDAL